MTSDIQELVQKRVGRLLNHQWRLEHHIATGGMAAVYAASHSDGRRAAIKVLHPMYSLDRRTRERFLREGYAANRVRHPGVVEIYEDDVTDDDEAFLVLELLHGRTLEQAATACPDCRLPMEVALPIMVDLLDVLASAHEAGIVHRDLKPANLFLTDEGVLKVLDFGLARLLEPVAGQSATLMGIWLGTPFFIAPEQARGDWDQVDGRADLWSVGAVMCTLLTGHYVHAARDVHKAVELAATRPVPSLRVFDRGLHSAVVHVIDRALAFDLDRRWPDAVTMKAKLVQAMREAGVTTVPRASLPAAIDRASTTPPRDAVAEALAELAPSWAKLSQKVTEGLNLLVVCADARTSEAIGLALQADGYRLELCHSAGEARWRAKTARYDLAIIDGDLHDQPAADLLASLAAGEDGLVCAMLLGEGELGRVPEVLELGAADYLLKPFRDLDQVRVRVRGILHRQLATRLYEAVVHDLTELTRRAGDTATEGGRVQPDAFRSALETGAQVLLVGSVGHDDVPVVGTLRREHISALLVPSVSTAVGLLHAPLGPTLALLDGAEHDVPQAVGKLKAADPFVEVLVVTDAREDAVDALDAGASDVVLRSEPAGALMGRVRRLLARGRNRRVYLHLMATLFQSARRVDEATAERILKVVPAADRDFVRRHRTTARLRRIVSEIMSSPDRGRETEP